MSFLYEEWIGNSNVFNVLMGDLKIGVIISSDDDDCWYVCRNDDPNYLEEEDFKTKEQAAQFLYERYQENQ